MDTKAMRDMQICEMTMTPTHAVSGMLCEGKGEGEEEGEGEGEGDLRGTESSLRRPGVYMIPTRLRLRWTGMTLLVGVRWSSSPWTAVYSVSSVLEQRGKGR